MNLHEYNMNKKTALAAIFHLIEGGRVFMTKKGDLDKKEEIFLNPSVEQHPSPVSLVFDLEAAHHGRYEFFDMSKADGKDNLSLAFDMEVSEDLMDQWWLDHAQEIELDKDWYIPAEELDHFKDQVQALCDLGKKYRIPMVVGFVSETHPKKGIKVHGQCINAPIVNRQDHGFTERVHNVIRSGAAADVGSGLADFLNMLSRGLSSEDDKKAG